MMRGSAKAEDSIVMAEANDQKKIRLAAAKLGYTLWRNNRGKAYQGKRIRDQDREVTLANYRLIEFGVGGNGGSDLIGFRSVTITQEMVGLTVAVFTAFECKRTQGRSNVSKDQQKYIDFVNVNGGIAAVVKTLEDIPG